MNHSELLPIFHETLFTKILPSEVATLKYGDFGRKVLVIVNRDDWNEAHEIFLKKILSSCNLISNDYLIVVVPDVKGVFEIINHFVPEILFLFAIKLESDFFSSNKTFNKPFTFNKIKIVLTDSLKLLMTDKDRRLLLWNGSIKPLFNIQ